MSFIEKPSHREELQKVSKHGTDTALLPRSVEVQFPNRDNVRMHTLCYTINVKKQGPPCQKLDLSQPYQRLKG